MRQCQDCGRLFPVSLGDGPYCSQACRAAPVRRRRAQLRLHRLFAWLRHH